MRPVSCTGKKPFGISTYKRAVSTNVAAATQSVSVWWSRTHVSIFAYLAIIPSMNAPVFRLQFGISSSE